MSGLSSGQPLYMRAGIAGISSIESHRIVYFDCDSHTLEVGIGGICADFDAVGCTLPVVHVFSCNIESHAVILPLYMLDGVLLSAHRFHDISQASFSSAVVPMAWWHYCYELDIRKKLDSFERNSFEKNGRGCIRDIVNIHMRDKVAKSNLEWLSAFDGPVCSKITSELKKCIACR